MQKKKALLKNQLECERAFIEQMRVSMEQLSARKDELSKQLSRMDSLLQSYEQHNFELEESCMEMKCTFQFLAHSIPVLVLYYSWAFLRNHHSHAATNRYRQLPSTRTQGALPPTIPASEKQSRGFSNRPPVRAKTSLVQQRSQFLAQNVNARKHKLIDHWAQRQHHEQEWKRPKADENNCERVYCSSNGTQTDEEAEHMAQVNDHTLEYMQRIQTLETNMSHYRELWENEKSNLVQLYEARISDKEKECQICREEKQQVQQKWTNLIQELEQYALCLGHTMEVNNEDTSGRQGIKLQPSSTSPVSMAIEEQRNQLNRLAQEREQALLVEIDALRQEVQSNASSLRLFSQLSEEHSRLQNLMNESERVWAEGQEEHEKLKGEMTKCGRRLEEMEKLRDRVEELEGIETSLKAMAAEMERRETKGNAKIQQLRDELQFLRNKCSQLQEELDARIEKETKYKSELHTMNGNLKEALAELQEKDSLLESNEAMAQAQVSQFQLHMLRTVVGSCV